MPMPVEKERSAIAKLNGMAATWLGGSAEKMQEIRHENAFFGDSLYSASYSLLGQGNRRARTRQQIYDKWMQMMGDPIISAALTVLVTAALGGNATTGDVLFIEAKPDAREDKKRMAVVEELRRDIAPLLNRIAFTVAYQGCGFGDAYARLYTRDGVGVIDAYTDEFVNPVTLLPYAQGSRTVGFVSVIGERQFDRLSLQQIARLKMPRRVYVPQVSVTEKAWRTCLTEDDIDLLPVLPDSVGGSFLYEAEVAYDHLTAALLGMNGQRVLDSIDERVLGVNMAGATAEQQKAIEESIIAMLQASKERAQRAVNENKPVLERIRHVLPFWNEKQVVNFDMGSPSASNRSGTVSIEDVMFEARRLSGTLGVDLSMIGFADQIAGGLGEGGFFRTSVMAAERARLIRAAVEEFCNHVIDVHCFHRYGGKVWDAKDRPWDITFYGTISALENERQSTAERRANTGQALLQAMAQAREVGFNEAQMQLFLSKQMALDEEEAKSYAPVMSVKPPDDGQGDGFGP